MVAILSLLFEIWYSLHRKSLVYFIIYQALILLAISTLIVNEVDVTYKLDLSKDSDTAMYYITYIDLNSDITKNIFPAYIYFLRIIEYPFHNALFVVWGQSIITFMLLDLGIKNKKNLLFVCCFHALLYTNAGMFKDNYILVISLLAYIFLQKSKSRIYEMIIIAISVLLLFQVRPFLKNFLIPLTLIPLWTHINSARIKKATIILGCIAGVVVWIMMQSYITGIMRLFENDTAVVDGRSSPLAAIVKILIGPTPMHYLLYNKFMVQPFCAEQSVLFFCYHLLFYFVLSFWIMSLFINYRLIVDKFYISTANIYILSLGLAQGLVYTVIYGSADIRQRAIIILFTFLATITHKDIFKIPNTYRNRLALVGLFGILAIITYISS